MATYNVTGAGGTTGHPSNGRTPYMVENTIDIGLSVVIQQQMMSFKRSMFQLKH